MDPYDKNKKKKRVDHAESLAEKLGKKPLFMVIITALITLLVSAIPFHTIFGLLPKLPGQISIADTSRSLIPWLSPPSLLFVVICLVILLIWFGSNPDIGGPKTGPKGGGQRTETKLSKGISSKRISQPTSLMETIFADQGMAIDGGDEVHIEHFPRAPEFDEDPQEEDPDDGFTNWQDKPMEYGVSSSTPAKDESSISKPSSGSNELGGVKKLSWPATSTSLPRRGPPPFGSDPKTPSSSYSFREDASQGERDELNEKFDSFLVNFKQQLRLQKLESIRQRQNHLDPLLEEKTEKRSRANLYPMENNILKGQDEGESEDGDEDEEAIEDLSVHELKERITEFLSEEKTEKRSNENLHPIEDNILEGEDEDEEVIEDLSVDKLKERITQYVSSSPEVAEPYHQEAYPTFAKTPFAENDYAPLDRPSPSVDAASASTQLSRKDSLAVENQKFDNFLKSFKDEQKMQKMQSLLRRQGD